MPRPIRRELGSPLETQVLQFADLQTLSGKTLMATVERWAVSQGIRYGYDGKGGIWTTVTALNAALGICPDAEPRKISGRDL